MQLTLTRTASTPIASTGLLTLNATAWHTIEQPWRDDLQGHSCVPLGIYGLIPYLSPKHGSTWCLHNPALNIYGHGPLPAGGRTFCEIHAANFASELEGCIALGLAAAPMVNPASAQLEPAVNASRAALDQFVGILGALSSGHTLNILAA